MVSGYNVGLFVLLSLRRLWTHMELSRIFNVFHAAWILFRTWEHPFYASNMGWAMKAMRGLEPSTFLSSPCFFPVLASLCVWRYSCRWIIPGLAPGSGSLLTLFDLIKPLKTCPPELGGTSSYILGSKQFCMWCLVCLVFKPSHPPVMNDSPEEKAGREFIWWFFSNVC